jgi:hypothetical protein
MIGTESLIDCLCTSFGGLGPNVVQMLDLSNGHLNDWDRVFDGLPTYLFWEDQVQT